MHYIKLNKLLKKPLYLQLAESIEQAFNQKELNAGDYCPLKKKYVSHSAYRPAW